jgi:hypothetical protein
LEEKAGFDREPLLPSAVTGDFPYLQWIISQHPKQRLEVTGALPVFAVFSNKTYL